MNQNKSLNILRNLALRLLGEILPPIEMARIMSEEAENYSALRFRDKIMRFLSLQEKDFEKSINFSSKFTKDSDGYKRNITLLIDTIESIRDDYIIDVYGSLFRAFLAHLIDWNIFMRLTSVISNIYYDDLNFLKDNYETLLKGIQDKTMTVSDFIILEKFLSQGLCQYRLSPTLNTTGMIMPPSKTYYHTIFGIELIKCGIDYENYCKYEIQQQTASPT